MIVDKKVVSFKAQQSLFPSVAICCRPLNPAPNNKGPVLLELASKVNV